MNSRECVAKALSHENGPVPLDLGATAVTGMHVSCVAALREYYGLSSDPVKVHEPFQMLGLIEPDLQECLGVDVEGVGGRTTLFGFANENWKEERMPWGQVVRVPADFVTSETPEGGLLIYPQGDRHAPPSGHMPQASFFFDAIVRQEPFEEGNLNVEDNLEEFAPLTDEDLAHLDARTERARGTGRAVVANIGGTGLGDIALVPAPFLKHPKGIRDVAEWYVSTISRQDFLHAVFDRQTEIALTNLETCASIARDRIDVLFVCGTDFGTQTSQFCSEETFRELYAPYYRRMNDWVHAHTPWKTFKHSCGAVLPLIDAFIDCGFDILNPVQCSAAGMKAEDLKKRFGNRLVFWGGGIDTQRTLPFGTTEDVRREVTAQCRTLSQGGGYVFNTVHNVQAQTPTENIVAMVDAVHAFNAAGAD